MAWDTERVVEHPAMTPPILTSSTPFFEVIVQNSGTPTVAEYKMQYVTPCDCGSTTISITNTHDSAFIGVTGDVIVFTLSNRPNPLSSGYSYT